MAMDLTLAQVAAGWPLAASLAVVVVRRVEGGRRRTALNECLHELRRPLQALALDAPRSGSPEGVESSLRLATQAMARLDREINGGGVAPLAIAPLLAEPLLRSSLARWRARAALAGCPLQLRWRAGEATLLGEAGRIEQAVDNLVLNAIEHGGTRIAVEASRRGSWMTIAVIDTGQRRARPLPRGGRGSRSDLRRHGHGLRVVRRVAAEHGGRFELRRMPGRTEAVLWLPLGAAPAVAS
jgi:signal transduction histidine kinase